MKELNELEREIVIDVLKKAVEAIVVEDSDEKSLTGSESPIDYCSSKSDDENRRLTPLERLKRKNELYKERRRKEKAE